jgi:hypothetical protein
MVLRFAQDEKFHGLGEETALRVLLQLLGDYEAAQSGAQLEVRAETLPHLLGEELQSQAIDVSCPGEQQLQEFLARSDDPVAFTREGRFDRIVDRDAINNSLLRQLIAPPTPG